MTCIQKLDTSQYFGWWLVRSGLVHVCAWQNSHVMHTGKCGSLIVAAKYAYSTPSNYITCLLTIMHIDCSFYVGALGTRTSMRHLASISSKLTLIQTSSPELTCCCHEKRFAAFRMTSGRFNKSRQLIFTIEQHCQRCMVLAQNTNARCHSWSSER